MSIRGVFVNFVARRHPPHHIAKAAFVPSRIAQTAGTIDTTANRKYKKAVRATAARTAHNITLRPSAERSQFEPPPLGQQTPLYSRQSERAVLTLCSTNLRPIVC
jgi:hypothetical protein